MKPRANKSQKPDKIKGTNKYDIDEKKIEMLAAKFWNNSEIAAFFGVDEGTIRKRFPNILLKGRELGKAKLRDKQLDVAHSGNVTMLIWLGKQYLGQKEEVINIQELPPIEIKII